MTFLTTLAERLSVALTAAELEQATLPPDGAAVRRSTAAETLRVDGRLLPHPVPAVTLELAAPLDASELCTAWGVIGPVAVSGDVNQRSWHVRVAGAPLPDPYATRIAATAITAGRWTLAPRLTRRPDGELPSRVSGASPAYELPPGSAQVRSIAIAPVEHGARTVAPADPEARALLDAMAAAEPFWRGGWTPDAAATFVVLDGGADAGAALAGGPDGLALASHLCFARADAELGAALLDVLEAVAADRGADRLRLDSSAFLHDVPWERAGYVTGPPYAGDADVPVWAEKSLGSAGRAGP